MYSNTPQGPRRSKHNPLSTKLELRDQADVHVFAAVGALHRDEPCVSSHQPNQPDAEVHSDAFDVGRPDGPDAL
jgi:hypothetical protein